MNLVNFPQSIFWLKHCNDLVWACLREANCFWDKALIHRVPVNHLGWMLWTWWNSGSLTHWWWSLPLLPTITPPVQQPAPPDWHNHCSYHPPQILGSFPGLQLLTGPGCDRWTVITVEYAQLHWHHQHHQHLTCSNSDTLKQMSGLRKEEGEAFNLCLLYTPASRPLHPPRQVFARDRLHTQLVWKIQWWDNPGPNVFAVKKNMKKLLMLLKGRRGTPPTELASFSTTRREGW